MIIFKLRTRHPALHPQLTDLIVRADGLKIEPHRFGAVVQRPETHPVVIPWSNVAEVEVDDVQAFLELASWYYSDKPPGLVSPCLIPTPEVEPPVSKIARQMVEAEFVTKPAKKRK